MTILECMFQLLYESDDSGVLGKVRKYAGDIGAGALAHTVANAHGQNNHVGGLGVLAAHKTYDVGSKNFQTKNKSLSGSAVGNLLGAGLSAVAHNHIKVS